MPLPGLPLFTTAVLAVLLASGCAGRNLADAAAEQDLLDRTAATHAADTPLATPAATTPPAGEVVAEDVAYASQGGQPVTGFLARPVRSGPVPGIIVIHEWWGLNDNIRDMTRRLAAEGYAALAVDLYGGQVADAPPDAIRLMQALTKDPAAAEDNLRQAYDWLDRVMRAPRIGTIGWCMGGRWSLRTALLLPEKVDATVIYYGSPRAGDEELARLQMPILGFFAGRDPLIPVPQVRSFEEALRKLGKPVEIHVYEGAQHAFANPSGGVYDAAAAEDAWRRTLAFFGEHLAGDGG